MTARHGLGLYICYSMTRLLHGDIEVESEVEKYTQFTVTLPNLMSEKRVGRRVEGASSQRKEGIESEKPKEERITNVEPFESTPNLVLVVDDNPEIVEFVSNILLRYSVVGVYSAAGNFTVLKTLEALHSSQQTS